MQTCWKCGVEIEEKAGVQTVYNLVIVVLESRWLVTRLLAAVLLCFVIVSNSACNGVFRVQGAIPNHSIVTGTVSIVELSTVIDGGIFVTVTIVTLINTGIPTRTTFCGDQTAFFPTDQFVTASFTPGTPCFSVVQVVIG